MEKSSHFSWVMGNQDWQASLAISHIADKALLALSYSENINSVVVETTINTKINSYKLK